MSPAPTMSQEEREQLILDVAERLILHYGFDKTTMSDIAKEAGISKGAIYLHYDGKDALFEAVITRDINRYATEAMRWVQDDSETWSFINIYKHAIVAVTKRKLLVAMMQNDERIFGSFLKRTQLNMMEIKRGVNKDMLRQMQEVGAIRHDIDISTTAFLLQAIGWGIINAHEFVGDAGIPPFEQIGNSLGQFLQNALIPDDGGNQEAGRKIFIESTKEVLERMNKQSVLNDKSSDAH